MTQGIPPRQFVSHNARYGMFHNPNNNSKMHKILCVMRDSKADIYGPVVQFDNDEVAVRAFFDICRDISTIVGKHPADFCLAKIGVYDDEIPVVEGCNYTVLAAGSDLVKEED